MAELIHEYSFVYRSDDGTSYVIRAWGESRHDGTWEAWLGFTPAGGIGAGGRELRTGQETTHPNRDAVVYWASGLEPIYFEGAFARAS